MMLQKWSLNFLINSLLFICCTTFSLLAADPPSGILTSGEYTHFLNAVAATDSYSLYNEKMQSDAVNPCIVRMGDPGCYFYQVIPARAEDPVLYVSELSAKRYCNWIQNGEPQGEQNKATTERGAYTLDGTMSDSPEKENNAACFLSSKNTNFYAPSLASNVLNYSIILSTEESFSLPQQSSNEQDSSSWTTLDTVVGVVAVIATAVAAYKCHVHPEEEQEDQRFITDPREQEEARNEDTHVSFNAATAGRSNAPLSLREENDKPSTAATLQQLAATTYVKYLELHNVYQDALTVKAANKSRGNENPPYLLAWLKNIEDRLNAVKKDKLLAQARISTLSNRVFAGDDNDLPQATLECIRNYYPELHKEFCQIKNFFHETEERLCWAYNNREFAGGQFDEFCDVLKEHQLLFDRNIWTASLIIAEQNKMLSASWAQPEEDHHEARQFVAENLRAACAHLRASYLVVSWMETALSQRVAPPAFITSPRKFRPDLNITTDLQNFSPLIEGTDRNCSISFRTPKSVTWFPGTPDNKPFQTTPTKQGMSANEASSSKKDEVKKIIIAWVNQAKASYEEAKNNSLLFPEVKRLEQEFLWSKQLSEKYFDRSLVISWEDQSEKEAWHDWATKRSKAIFQIAITSGILNDWEESNTDSEEKTSSPKK